MKKTERIVLHHVPSNKIESHITSVQANFYDVERFLEPTAAQKYVRSKYANEDLHQHTNILKAQLIAKQPSIEPEMDLVRNTFRSRSVIGDADKYNSIYKERIDKYNHQQSCASKKSERMKGTISIKNLSPVVTSRKE